MSDPHRNPYTHAHTGRPRGSVDSERNPCGAWHPVWVRILVEGRTRTITHQKKKTFKNNLGFFDVLGLHVEWSHPTLWRAPSLPEMSHSLLLLFHSSRTPSTRAKRLQNCVLEWTGNHNYEPQPNGTMGGRGITNNAEMEDERHAVLASQRDAEKEEERKELRKTMFLLLSQT